MAPLIPYGLIFLLASRGIKGARGKSAGDVKLGPWLGVWFIAGLAGALAAGAGGLVGLLYISPLLVLLFPWLLVRYVCVPLGWPGAAYRFSLLCFWTLSHARKSGATFAAALALSRAQTHDEALAGRIARRATKTSLLDSKMTKLNLDDVTLDAPSVAALGFLEVSRGDRAAARTLLLSALDFQLGQPPPVVLRTCLDWLAADAWDRGDHDSLLALAANHRPWFVRGWTSLRIWVSRAILRRRQNPRREPWTAVGLPATARFFVMLARSKMTGRLASWPALLATCRPALWPIFQAARAPQPATALESSSPADPLTAALSLHARASRDPARVQDAAAMQQLCAAWEKAFADGAVPVSFLQREMALGCREAENTFERLKEAIVDDLAALAADAGTQLAQGSSPLLDQVVRRSRADALRRLESAVHAREERLHRRKVQDVRSELEEFAQLRRAYEQVSARGPDSRQLALRISRGAMWNGASWLHNECEQRQFAHAQFRWLLRECEACGDAIAAEAMRKNVAVSIER